MTVTVESSDVLDEFVIEEQLMKRVNDLISLYYDSDFHDIVIHQAATGGKRIRPVLALLFSEMVGKDYDEEVMYAMIVVELLHTYSLIFDDIIDKGKIRRKKPTTRIAYGDKMAILAGMALREIVDRAVDKLKKKDLARKNIAECLLSAIDGERLDILFEQKNIDHSYIKKKQYREINFDQYFDMIIKKTAIPFAFACKMGIDGFIDDIDKSEAAYNFGLNIGIAFQIIDDILDIVGEQDTFGKEIGKDIIEGKFGNYVILHTYLYSDKNVKKIIRNALTAKNPSNANIRKVIKHIEMSGAIEHAKASANRYIEKARNFLSCFNECDAKEYVVLLTEFFIERTR